MGREALRAGAGCTFMDAHGLGLVAMTAATFCGWGLAFACTSGLERRRRRQRASRLAVLDGTSVSADRTRLGTGTEVQLELLHDQRVDLRIRIPVPGLPAGARLDSEPVSRRNPVVGVLHLGLAQNGLLDELLELRARAGALEVGRTRGELPSERRLRDLVRRLEGAAQGCAALREPEAARSAALRGLLDPCPWVRYSAALLTGGLGRTVLERLARDRHQDLELRICALRAFLERAEAAETGGVLERCAAAGPERLNRFAVRSLASLSGGDARLARLLARDRLKPEVAELAVELLAVRGPAVEVLFLSALPTAAPGAQRAILEHLAAHGGARSHVALDSLLSRGGLGVRLDGVLRRAARLTRGRLETARGALSALDDDTRPRGGLALSDGPASAESRRAERPRIIGA